MKALFCTMVGHRRSRRDARRINDQWTSYCRRCGRPMIRQGPQQWTLMEVQNGIASPHERDEA